MSSDLIYEFGEECWIEIRVNVIYIDKVDKGAHLRWREGFSFLKLLPWSCWSQFNATINFQFFLFQYTHLALDTLHEQDYSEPTTFTVVSKNSERFSSTQNLNSNRDQNLNSNAICSHSVWKHKLESRETRLNVFISIIMHSQ